MGQTVVEEYWDRNRCRVIPIHHVPQFEEECCLLINLEWKRSLAARMRTIKNSCCEFPTNLVLLYSKESGEMVIGHSKITLVPAQIYSVFIESVVIHPQYRGIGLGRYLMEETEAYCKSKGIKQVFLSTHDQEKFYRKLGYIETEPINIYGCNNFLFRHDSEKTVPTHLEDQVVTNNNLNSVPVPPPLPSIPPPTSHFSSTVRVTTKQFFKKKI